MSKLCSAAIVTSSFVLMVPRTTLHFALEKTSREHPVRDITSVNRINAREKKKGEAQVHEELKRGCTRFAFAGLLRQEKNIVAHS